VVIVDGSLRADALARRRAASLRSGAVDHFFHYQGTRQAQLWLDVHRAHAPQFSDPALEEPYRRMAAAAASLIPRADVVALGPGAGSKERIVLEALAAGGTKARYLPIDASVELALLSADTATGLVAEVAPVAGDLSRTAEIEEWLAGWSADRPRIVTAFGLSPNTEPSRFFPQLAALLRPGDLLLVSANLAPFAGEDNDAAYAAGCAAIAPQYDNAETLRWLSYVLTDWGIADRLSPLRFEQQSIEGINGFFASASWLKNETFDWEGEPFETEAGRALRVFFSLRYTPVRFEAALERYGLQPLERAIDRTGQEGVWLARRVP
jgi:uncharacterized SAM-dependent methyltransferase